MDELVRMDSVSKTGEISTVYIKPKSVDVVCPVTFTAYGRSKVIHKNGWHFFSPLSVEEVMAALAAKPARELAAAEE